MKSLTKNRRKFWIEALKRAKDLSESFLNTAKICADHFVSGSKIKTYEDSNSSKEEIITSEEEIILSEEETISSEKELITSDKFDVVSHSGDKKPKTNTKDYETGMKKNNLELENIEQYNVMLEIDKEKDLPNSSNNDKCDLTKNNSSQYFTENKEENIFKTGSRTFSLDIFSVGDKSSKDTDKIKLPEVLDENPVSSLNSADNDFEKTVKCYKIVKNTKANTNKQEKPSVNQNLKKKTVCSEPPFKTLTNDLTLPKIELTITDAKENLNKNIINKKNNCSLELGIVNSVSENLETKHLEKDKATDATSPINVSDINSLINNSNPNLEFSTMSASVLNVASGPSLTDVFPKNPNITLVPIKMNLNLPNYQVINQNNKKLILIKPRPNKKPMSTVVSSNNGIDCIEIISDDENVESSTLTFQNQKCEELDFNRQILDKSDMVLSLLKFPLQKRLDKDQMKILSMSLPRPQLSETSLRYETPCAKNWLVGSLSNKKYFCWYCLLFSKCKSKWSSTGIEDRKDFVTIALKHSKRKEHRTCTLLFHSHVNNTLSEDDKRFNILYNIKIKKNRDVFKILLDTMLFLVYEKHRIKNDLIRLLTLERLKSNLELQHIFMYQNNFAELSETIFYELINIIQDKLHDHIHDEISKTDFFTAFIDDISDITGLSKCAVSVRFVNGKGIIQERFMGIYDIEKGKADSIFKLILKVFDKYSHKTKLIAYSCDGGSVTSQELNKIDFLLNEHLPKVQLITCTTRSLSFIIEQCCSYITKVKSFFSDLRILYKLFNLIKLYNKGIIDANVANFTLPSLNDLCVLKCADLKFVISHKDSLILVITEISNLKTVNSDINIYTKYCLNKLFDIEFLFYLHLFKDIFDQCEMLDLELKNAFKKTNFNDTLQSINILLNTLSDWKQLKMVVKYLHLANDWPPPRQEVIQDDQECKKINSSFRNDNIYKDNLYSESFLNYINKSNMHATENNIEIKQETIDISFDESEAAIKSILIDSKSKSHTIVGKAKEFTAQKTKENVNTNDTTKRATVSDYTKLNGDGIGDSIKTTQNNFTTDNCAVDEIHDSLEINIKDLSKNNIKCEEIILDDENVKQENSDEDESLIYFNDSDDVFSEDETALKHENNKLGSKINFKSNFNTSQLQTEYKIESEIVTEYYATYCMILDNILTQLKNRFFKFDNLKYLRLADTLNQSICGSSATRDLLVDMFERCHPFIKEATKENFILEYEIAVSSILKPMQQCSLPKFLRLLNQNDAQKVIPVCYKMFEFLATLPLTHNANCTGFFRIRKFLKNCETSQISNGLPWIVIENELLKELQKTENFYEEVMEKFSAKGYVSLSYAPEF